MNFKHFTDCTYCLIQLGSVLCSECSDVSLLFFKMILITTHYLQLLIPAVNLKHRNKLKIPIYIYIYISKCI